MGEPCIRLAASGGSLRRRTPVDVNIDSHLGTGSVEGLGGPSFVLHAAVEARGRVQTDEGCGHEHKFTFSSSVAVALSGGAGALRAPPLEHQGISYWLTRFAKVEMASAIAFGCSGAMA
jgi:hypothetical protein